MAWHTTINADLWLRCLVKPVQYDYKFDWKRLKTTHQNKIQAQSSCSSGDYLYCSQQKCVERRLFKLSGYNTVSASGQSKDIQTGQISNCEGD